MNAVATPTRTRAKKVATPAAAVQQDRVKVHAPTDFGSEQNFMQGKALAALMIREAFSRDDGCIADLNASYREPGDLQDNFTHAFLQVVLQEPHLLPGFSAALSSMLAQGLENDPGIPESAATISYEACTTHRTTAEYEKWKSHTEPTLSEQIAYFGLQDLEGEVLALQTSVVDTANVADVQETFAELAMYRTTEAIAVLSAVAQANGGHALFGLITILNKAHDVLARNLTAPDREGCLEASLYLAQCIALLQPYVDQGEDMLLDAALTILLRAEETLDNGRKGFNAQ